MTKTVRRSEQGKGARTRERIIDAAVLLLDADGEAGLTFRTLAMRLETGHGAIQWHFSTKGDLIAAAADVVVGRALTGAAPGAGAGAREAIRAVALAVYDVIGAHPWVGDQLARPPWAGAMLKIFERLGRQVVALGVPAEARFTATSALLIHIVGAGRQEAINSHSLQARTDRQDFLDDLAAHWGQLDAGEYAFTRTMADQLRGHDDRAEFLAGVDLVLAGIEHLEHAAAGHVPRPSTHARR
ncbi:TetR family transcriptional regulator [Actinoplanes philippinensis]|uniref:Tetracyclin repressor, C-terminal all-alpha domain n=1 Tax=Actinoplanes philippinensis TaxID=35752 RepID=A0A1I2GSS6_9ACTN|nr:TetR/AcrR family transcriptional regulator [Actinoplanes philippinensis]GIE78009.1 TetR family transcriptional regulator [Actinoplanes philippinensis]SFF19887.1 Tetracyclin repressor, C-terminal all-alpha domain [Actinoplanes philippinensis]